MKRYKKTLLGSIVAIVVGTSCCWLSSITIWFGGAAILGTITSFAEDVQLGLIIVGTTLFIGVFYVYLKRKQRVSTKKNIRGDVKRNLDDCFYS